MWYGCFFPLNSIHALKKKLTIILVERKIGVIFIKPVYIIGGCTYIDSFMNGNICMMECITYIQNTVSESMHINNRNVDSKEVSMCHRNV